MVGLARRRTAGESSSGAGKTCGARFAFADVSMEQRTHTTPSAATETATHPSELIKVCKRAYAIMSACGGRQEVPASLLNSAWLWQVTHPESLPASHTPLTFPSSTATPTITHDTQELVKADDAPSRCGRIGPCA